MGVSETDTASAVEGPRRLDWMPPAAAVRLAPPAAVLALAAVAAWRERGSIAAVDWLPYAFVATAVLAIVLLSGAAARPSRAAVAAVGALAALGAFGAISIAWSPAPGLAREEALLVAFYAVALLVPVAALRTAGERLALTALVGGVLAALALATGARLLAGGDPLELFRDRRLISPLSYANADAALFLVGFWPCVVAAARRSTHALLRGAAFAGATAILAATLLAQSKGGLVGLAVSMLVLVAVSPARLRLLVPALVSAALVAIWFSSLSAPFNADSLAQLERAVHDAGLAVVLATAIALPVGVAYALADRRLRLAPRARLLVGRAALALTVLVVVGGPAGFLVSVDSPGGWIEGRWRSFKTLPRTETASTHLLTLGSNRYDFWRVELDGFAKHPLAGIGARGFALEYLRRGRSLEEPARGHSVLLDVLLEEGLVGGALLLAALGIPLVAAARRARTRKLPATAALGAGACFVAHACVDWTWSFPAVGVPAFLLLGVALARDGDRSLPRGAAFAGGCAALALALVPIGATWLSGDLVGRIRDEPYAQGARDADRARRLDPISAAPIIAQGSVAPTPAASLAYFREAVRREPRSLAAWYCVTVTSLEAGRRAEARRALAALVRLGPRERFVLPLAEVVRGGRGVPQSCRLR